MPGWAGIVVEWHKHRVLVYLLLAAITLTAAGLRMHRLGEWSFWLDEASTVSGTEDGFNYTWVRRSLATSLIQTSTQVLGLNEWSARLVPALIGIATVPILFFPLRRLFGVEVAMLACAMLAVSPWHLYWSQNARFYTLLLLFYSLALLLLYWAVEAKRPALALLAVALMVLATRERLLALFLVPVAAGYGVLLFALRFEDRRKLRGLLRLWWVAVPAVLLALFFAGPYLLNWRDWLTGFGRVNNDPVWLAAGVVYYVGLPTVCLALGGSAYLLAQKNRAALYLAVSALLPLAALMLMSLFQYTANRYAFITLPSWIILASLAAREMGRHLRGQARWLAAGVVLLLLVAPLADSALYFRYQNGNRDNWKAAFAYIREQSAPGDLVVSSSRQVGELYMDTAVIGLASITPEQMEAAGERVWVVADMNVPAVLPAHYAWLLSRTRAVANFDVHVHARVFTMRVYLYEPPAGAAPGASSPAAVGLERKPSAAARFGADL